MKDSTKINMGDCQFSFNKNENCLYYDVATDTIGFGIFPTVNGTMHVQVGCVIFRNVEFCFHVVSLK